MKPGIYKDISIEDYHSDKDWYSSTGLKKAKKSLKLFKMYIDGYFDDTFKNHFDFGNAFELALLDEEQFNNKVSVEDEIFIQILTSKPDVKSPRSTTQYKEWVDQQRNSDKYIVTEDSFSIINEMLKSCYQDSVIQKLIKNIEYNYSLFWVDPATGLTLKTRPDICKSKKNIIVNLKTAIDGSPEKFFSDCAKYDYPFQACMEIDGVIKSGMMPQVDNYFWLVCEKEAPFSATLYEFTKEDQMWVFDEYRYILGIVAQAKREQIWPSYSQRSDNKYGIIDVKLPLWYRNYML